MTFGASFLLAGVIFHYLLSGESYLEKSFKTRSFDIYCMFFGFDLIAELLILIIVSVTLQYNGFFGFFSNLINQL